MLFLLEVDQNFGLGTKTNDKSQFGHGFVFSAKDTS